MSEKDWQSSDDRKRKRFADPTDESPRVKLSAEEQKSLDELVALNQSSGGLSAGAAAALGPIAPEDAAALPKFHKGLLLALAVTYLFQFSFSKLFSGFSGELWIHLPMQLYWTFCLYRLSRVAGSRYNDNPPLGDPEVLLLSILSFVSMPVFAGYHFAPRWLDPIFWTWAATQFYWTAKFGLFLDKKGESRRQAALASSACSGAWDQRLYSLRAVFSTAVLDAFVVLSALVHIAILVHPFLALKLQGKFEEKKAALKSEPMLYAGSDRVISYRPFIAVERWLKERFSQRARAGGGRLTLMWFVLPVILLGSILGLFAFIQHMAPVLQSSAVPAAGAVTDAAAAARAGNQSFLTVFLTALFGATGLGTIIYMKEPTHIGFGPDGMRFLWRHKLSNQDGLYTAWNDIVRIAMVRPHGKTSPLDDLLCFQTKFEKSIEIKMGSIGSVEDRETVLKAIRKYAPTVSRDPSVEQALQPPSDYSYTELWLQALSAPPKRERLQPLLSGAFLRDGRYEVMQSLGTGGQGQAYLAQDTSSGQKIVLKEFILPVFVDVNVRRSALEQFENEARILRHLDHPQIVKMTDFFVEDHRAYLVLEHIQGASLRDIVKDRGRLPERQVRMLASQMCDILSYLHGLSPPVVHRDFTPDNLILNVDGTLKLIDFNVARQSVESTTSGTVVGKHAYLPPEQFRGMPEAQSDIYAMGATLFFLLTGTDPEPISVSHPGSSCSEVSQGLNAVVEKATALDLKKRYQSASDLKAALSSPSQAS